MFWIVFMTLQRTPTPIGRNVKCYYTEHLIKVKKKSSGLLWCTNAVSNLMALILSLWFQNYQVFVHSETWNNLTIAFESKF